MCEQVHIVFQMDNAEEWCVDSVHATLESAKGRQDKLAEEGDYDGHDTELYLDIQDFKVLGKKAGPNVG